MKHARFGLIAYVLLAAAIVPTATAAQSLSPQPVVRIGQDVSVAATESVREVVVIGGSAKIAGSVEDDVVVVLGSVDLAGTARIGGDLVVVGGTPAIAPGASLAGDLVVVGGAFEPPPGFSPGGEQMVVGSAAAAQHIQSKMQWITRGLFLGRPIVPELPWIWTIVAIVFALYAGVNYVFDGPVTATATTIGEKPLTTFLTGLLVLLLLGPMTLLLIVSVIGIVVVPFLFCAMFLAWIVGKVGVDRWIGSRLVAEGPDPSKSEMFRSFAIGFTVIILAYMVPVLGFVTWTIVGVLSLGAATLALIEGYRREHPAAETPAPVAASYFPPTPPPPVLVAEDVAPPAPPATAPAVSDLVSFPRAAFLERLAAFVLDAILVMIVSRVLDPFRHGPGGVFFLMLAYHIGFWAWKGTTVGGIICQLRIVRVDGTPIRFADALVRGLSSIFSMAVLGLGFLWILRDPDRQAWHDKIAGTYVVKVPRNWPL